jgi:hypothetical protein
MKRKMERKRKTEKKKELENREKKRKDSLVTGTRRRMCYPNK